MRTLIVAMVLALATPTWAAPAPKDAEKARATAHKVRQQYVHAKKLFKQGNYEASRALFVAIRNGPLYHPIVDYWIGRCYEAEKTYNTAIGYFKLYVKLYGNGYPVSKKHPIKAAVDKRIAKLQNMITAPPVPASGQPMVAQPASNTTTTDSGSTGTMTPISNTPSGTTPANSTATPATMASTTPTTSAVPPPPPTAPPTRQGSQAQYYSAYWDAPPPGYVRYGARGRHAIGRTLFVTAEVGGMGFSGDISEQNHYGGGVMALAGVFFRPFPYLSAGVLAGGAGAFPNSDAPDGQGAMTMALAGVELRGHFPLSYFWHPFVMDIWGGLSAGYMYTKAHYANVVLNGVGITTDDTSNAYFIGAAVGARSFVTPWLSVGGVVRVLVPQYTKNCFNDICGKPGKGNDKAYFVGVTASFHLYIF